MPVSEPQRIAAALLTIVSLSASYGVSLLGISRIVGRTLVCSTMMLRTRSAIFCEIRTIPMSDLSRKLLRVVSMVSSSVSLSTIKKLV